MKLSPRALLNKPFTPSCGSIVRQVEMPRFFVGGMSADIQKVKCPSLLRRCLLAPGFEITLLVVVIPMASAMAGGGMRAALALVDGVMVVNLLTSADRLSAKIAGHISMPPIRKPRSHLKWEHCECSQAFLMRTDENCLEPIQACCSSS